MFGRDKNFEPNSRGEVHLENSAFLLTKINDSGKRYQALNDSGNFFGFLSKCENLKKCLK